MIELKKQTYVRLANLLLAFAILVITSWLQGCQQSCQQRIILGHKNAYRVLVNST